jgi:phage gp36-like protein
MEGWLDGWFNRKGQARIKESCLQVTRLSQDIEEAGELDLTKVPPAVVIHGAMIYSVFQAKFESPLTSQPIMLAFGASYPNHYRLSSHDDKTTILFDFTAGLVHLHLARLLLVIFFFK